jgi:hypothetical protein
MVSTGEQRQMDANEIQKRLDPMPAKMSAKGLIQPKADYVIEANSEGRVSIGWYATVADKNNYRWSSEWFRDGSIAERLDAAEKFIADLPSKEETKFKEFMGALGAVIDLGKANDIEVEFMNPLVATMKKLSENALTHQPA